MAAAETTMIIIYYCHHRFRPRLYNRIVPPIDSTVVVFVVFERKIFNFIPHSRLTNGKFPTTGATAAAAAHEFSYNR